jgi:hypothetical protein
MQKTPRRSTKLHVDMTYLLDTDSTTLGILVDLSTTQSNPRTFIFS